MAEYDLALDDIGKSLRSIAESLVKLANPLMMATAGGPVRIPETGEVVYVPADVADRIATALEKLASQPKPSGALNAEDIYAMTHQRST
jgi:hypothetical protein